MIIRHFARLITISCIGFAATSIIVAQEGQQTRSITSDDFGKSRPPAAAPLAKPNGRPVVTTRKRITYKLIKHDKAAIRWKSTGSAVRPKTVPAGKPVSSDIGVTVWKMRRPLPTDQGVKLPVKVGNKAEMWSSVRVDPLSPFKAGDLIRLAVESPTQGYLYVINSEISADGRFGEPTLIFPAPANQSNSVSPGMLVDIPDQKEDFPYFRLDPKKGNYAGELVAVIITPVKLDFRVDGKGKILNIGSVIDLQVGVDVQIFDSGDLQGQVYTKAESKAACGSKSRDLTRDSEEQSPCGAQSRSLTRDEPMPQTIYRVNAYSGQPAIALIRLSATQ